MSTSFLLKCCVLIILHLATLSAQQTDVSRIFVQHPAHQKAFDFQAAIGSSVTFVPRPIAEEQIRQIPIAEANLRFDLPLGFSLRSRLGSNYITNIVSLGAQWSVSYKGLSCAIGDNQTLWYGFAEMDGFDVDAIGWINAPNISLGLTLDEVLISIRAEMLFVSSRSTRVGEVEIGYDKNFRAGGSIAVYVEQPFFKQTHLMLGLKLNNLKNAYQSWLAFATFSDPLIYPEFSLGLLL